LTKAVVVGRHTPNQHLPNDTIHQIVSADPVFVGVGSVDPIVQGRQAALDETERAIRNLGLKGIDVEPGFGSPPRHPDDPAYFPVYDLLQSLGVPVFVMSGPTTPDPRFNDPSGLAIVAQNFPQLKIAAFHGYWPNVEAIVGLAFRYENIHLIPDMYIFQAGSRTYVEAANGPLADQLLFGSSYPFRPIRQSIEDFQVLGFKDAVLERVFYKNAERLLNL
jgi:predicted TIM-barrel fold metal-dependent hydrolase